MLQITGCLQFEFFGSIASGCDLDRKHGRALVPTALRGLIRPTHADIRNQPTAVAETIRLLSPDARVVEKGFKKLCQLLGDYTVVVLCRGQIDQFSV